MTGSRKPRKASWRELPPAEMAAHLLVTPTISDGAKPNNRPVAIASAIVNDRTDTSMLMSTAGGKV